MFPELDEDTRRDIALESVRMDAETRRAIAEDVAFERALDAAEPERDADE